MHPPCVRSVPPLACNPLRPSITTSTHCAKAASSRWTIGVVTAGIPILAVENIEGYIPWDGESGCFALRVRGDSMIGAGILDGDKVVVRPQQSAENGEIVVALLEDSATVKRLKKKGAEVWLMPENPAYDPIDGRAASILGKVKAVIREY